MSEVKVIALGGVGEIGKNCSLVEQGDDIVVVDCGLSFPNEEMLGVDIVVPDFTYLIENKERVKGVFLTHAHEDHVGGLSYLLKSIDVPVYCTEFTHALIKHKMEERLPGKKIDFKITRAGEKVNAGELEVEFIRVTHSIPENCSLAIKTIHGHVLFTGDFKFDFTPVDNKLSDLKRFGELGEEGVVLLLSDSTNVERTGWGPSESLVAEGLRKVFAEAKGRVLLTTFASNIHRMQQAFNMAYETGRKVAVVGRSMERNLEICMRLGYLRIPDYTMISLQDAKSLPDHEVVLLTTGSQGEPLSALVQMSKGEYGRMQIREGDTLIYSARPIPGNEGAIWRTINRLFQQGCKVVYDSATPIHVSGHAYQEELKMMINLTKPFYIAPVHGEPRHQFLYNQIAAGMGYPDHRRFTLEAGIPLVMDEKKAYLGEAVATGRVLVDNSGTPGVTDEVLRDRYNVANDGLIIISIAVDSTHGEIVGDLNLMAKGFHGPAGILDQAKDVLIDLLSSMNPSDIKDLNKVKTESADLVRKFLGKRIKLRPLIVPSVIEV
ncbi:MAG: ribonuclease J [Armatimonadota bacterium]